jgi:methyl-accepting chemotaxis protein
METRVCVALGRGSAGEAAASVVEDLKRQLGGQEAAMAMFFASTRQPLEEVMSRAAGKLGEKTVALGSSTSGEFTHKEDSKGSVAAVAVAGDFVVRGGMGTGLKADPAGAVGAAVRALPSSEAGFPHRTVLMLLDPLSGAGEEATLVASMLLGEQARLAGGAAGDDLGMKSTQVGLGTRVASDAAVLASIFSKKPLGVGVQHGHEPISGPLTVTQASGSTVQQIDGRPAWEVWVEQTRARAKRLGIDATKLKDSEVIGFLLRYEAGLANGSEFKIRAPLSLGPNGSINFACGIPQGAEIRITESIAERQISSARGAARRALAQVGDGGCAGAIVFDCICRNLILDRAFHTAVGAISEELGGVPLAGFETYGEIALDAGDLSGFHNTTTVVLGFPS